MIFPQKNVKFLRTFSIFGENFNIGILMEIFCFRHILPTFDRHLKTWFYKKKTTFFQKNVSKSQHVTWFSKLGFSSFSVRNHDSSHPREKDFWWFFWSKPFFFFLSNHNIWDTWNTCFLKKDQIKITYRDFDLKKTRKCDFFENIYIEKLTSKNHRCDRLKSLFSNFYSISQY